MSIGWTTFALELGSATCLLLNVASMDSPPKLFDPPGLWVGYFAQGIATGMFTYLTVFFAFGALQRSCAKFWYETIKGQTCPPFERPWYHVLTTVILVSAIVFFTEVLCVCVFPIVAMTLSERVSLIDKFWVPLVRNCRMAFDSAREGFQVMADSGRSRYPGFEERIQALGQVPTISYILGCVLNASRGWILPQVPIILQITRSIWLFSKREVIYRVMGPVEDAVKADFIPAIVLLALLVPGMINVVSNFGTNMTTMAGDFHLPRHSLIIPGAISSGLCGYLLSDSIINFSLYIDRRFFKVVRDPDVFIMALGPLQDVGVSMGIMCACVAAFFFGVLALPSTPRRSNNPRIEPPRKGHVKSGSLRPRLEAEEDPVVSGKIDNVYPPRGESYHRSPEPPPVYECSMLKVDENGPDGSSYGSDEDAMDESSGLRPPSRGSNNYTRMIPFTCPMDDRLICSEGPMGSGFISDIDDNFSKI